MSKEKRDPLVLFCVDIVSFGISILKANSLMGAEHPAHEALVTFTNEFTAAGEKFIQATKQPREGGDDDQPTG